MAFRDNSRMSWNAYCSHYTLSASVEEVELGNPAKENRNGIPRDNLHESTGE